MARLVFGGDDVTTRGAAGTAVLAATNDAAVVYTDSGGTILADLTTYPGGVAITSSSLTVDAYSRLPLFNGPNDGTDTLYVVVAGGPVTAIYARTNDRLESEAATRAANDTANLATATGRALAFALVLGG